MTVRIHHFFVPHRLVWDGFEDFITGGPDGTDASTPPTIQTSSDPNTVLNYYGLPLVDGVDVSALPVRGYNAIFNEYYRDQDLVAEKDQEDTSIHRCAWEKDYFTSARPWPQKGPGVTIPLGGPAPVYGLGYSETDGTGKTITRTSSGSAMPPGDAREAYVEYSVGHVPRDFPMVTASLAEATGIEITELRRALAVQRYQEARARYGSRYVEYLRYLGVKGADGRLDRPEYLGGGRARVNVSEVLQTAPETLSGPGTEYGVGDMYGHGIAALRSNRYRRFFDEHGYVHSLLSVRPKSIYMHGIERHWLRKDKEDFFQKELVHIGQQPILDNELYADPANGESVFGYQDRYREYREQPSLITGEFRDTLNYWHLGRDFEDSPVLNQSFVECNPSKRIFNEQTHDSLWVMIQHSLVARRLVPRGAAARII